MFIKSRCTRRRTGYFSSSTRSRASTQAASPNTGPQTVNSTRLGNLFASISRLGRHIMRKSTCRRSTKPARVGNFFGNRVDTDTPAERISHRSACRLQLTQPTTPKCRNLAGIFNVDISPVCECLNSHDVSSGICFNTARTSGTSTQPETSEKVQKFLNAGKAKSSRACAFVKLSKVSDSSTRKVTILTFTSEVLHKRVRQGTCREISQ